MPESIECSCSIDMYYDGGSPRVFSESYPRAAKVHTCCECREPIEVGQRHELVKGLWDDSWESYRTCSPCAQIRRDHCCTWIYGELREAIWDSMDFDYVTGEDRDAEE